MFSNQGDEHSKTRENGPTLTRAQRHALEVLGRADGWVRGGKHSSQDKPVPYVNSRAAGELARQRLVDTSLPDPALWSPFTHDTKYRINDAGREVLRAR